MKKILLASASALLLNVAVNVATAGATSSTYSYVSPGIVQSYTVPAGTTQISVTVRGGDGAGVGLCNGDTLGNGGGGAIVSTILTVTPGQVLSLYAGGAGDPGRGGANDGLGGWGYEHGGNGDPWGSGGGGGSSAILAGSTPLVIAGGGGGGGRSVGANGGNGAVNASAQGGNGGATPSTGAGQGGGGGSPTTVQSSTGYGGGGGGGYGNGTAGASHAAGYQDNCGNVAYSGTTNGGGGAGGSYSATPATFTTGAFVSTGDMRVGTSGSITITPLVITIPYTAPTSPTGVSATVNAGSSLVSFTPGTTGNLPTYYEIDMLVGGQPAGNVCNVVLVTSCAISNLAPNVNFAFTVTAINALGSATSSPSNPSSYTVAPPTAPPTTTTTAPVLRTITCVKNGIVKKITGSSPTCPAGYTKK